MFTLKHLKTLQHVSINIQIIFRELVCSLLKSLFLKFVKNVKIQCSDAAAWHLVYVCAFCVERYAGLHSERNCPEWHKPLLSIITVGENDSVIWENLKLSGWHSKGTFYESLLENGYPECRETCWHRGKVRDTNDFTANLSLLHGHSSRQYVVKRKNT